MDVFNLHLILMLCVSLASASIIKWLPSASLSIPYNYRPQSYPCSKKTVVFPETLNGAVDLQTVMDVAGLVLPHDGEILLDNAIITIGEDLMDDACKEGTSYFWNNKVNSWTQAGAWSSARFNAATPDSERIPCYDDIVQFPGNAEYSVGLPDVTQTVRELRIHNQTYTTDSFRNRIAHQTDERQQFVLNKVLETGVAIETLGCSYRFGCPCQMNRPEIDCKAKYCPVPSCDAPIKVEGYCCSLCGGQLTFTVNEAFIMEEFKNFVGNFLDNYKNLVYHIGVTQVTPEPKVQVVVMENGEYTGVSVEAISSIDKDIKSHWYKGPKLAQISGTPLYKKGLGGKLFLSMFFVVALTIGSLYLYYYKLPTVRVPVVGGSRLFSRSIRSESVVSLTRRDSTALGSRAFRNPLYDSKRERVVVEETVDE